MLPAQTHASEIIQTICACQPVGASHVRTRVAVGWQSGAQISAWYHLLCVNGCRTFIWVPCIIKVILLYNSGKEKKNPCFIWYISQPGNVIRWPVLSADLLWQWSDRKLLTESKDGEKSSGGADSPQMSPLISISPSLPPVSFSVLVLPTIQTAFAAEFSSFVDALLLSAILPEFSY